MTHEHQERLDDYLELERYIETLQAGKVAQPPTGLTPEQARIYHVATLFFSADPKQAEPRLAFAEHLKEQLLLASQDPRSASSDPVHLASPPSLLSPAEPLQAKRRETPERIRFFSRRHLLHGGAIATVLLVIGGSVEWVREQRLRGTTATRGLEIATSVPTTWHFVTTLDALGQGVVRFTSDTLIGYILRDSTGRTLLALSASCTHMGCLVQWQEADHHFHCPCHSALFTEDGTNVTSHYRSALPPLPRLKTKIEHGKVYVEVPT